MALGRLLGLGECPEDLTIKGGVIMLRSQTPGCNNVVKYDGGNV